jgi:hypothetical protein
MMYRERMQDNVSFLNPMLISKADSYIDEKSSTFDGTLGRAGGARCEDDQARPIEIQIGV